LSIISSLSLPTWSTKKWIRKWWCSHKKPATN